MPRLAWFNCFSGIAGDMALGALIDAGADRDSVIELVKRLPVDGLRLEFEPVMRCGLVATKAKVFPVETTSHRTAASILSMIEEANLPKRAAQRALNTFRALAEAEGRLHNQAPSSVQFHEVGAIDSIVDVVGVCAALEILDIDQIHSSSVAMGNGMISTAHGLLPVPAPATVGLLVGALTHGTDVPFELTTPTGAALLSANAISWGPMPAIAVEASGFGAGDRDLDGRPNVTQVVLGQSVAQTGPGQPLQVLEVNVDDVTGEILAHTINRCLEAGVYDAWVTPIIMKKGRPAHIVTVVCDPARVEEFARFLTTETGSFGVRGHVMERWPVARSFEEVEVMGECISVKVTSGRVKPEFDDVAVAARRLGLPLREVISLAEEAWRKRDSKPFESAPKSKPV